LVESHTNDEVDTGNPESRTSYLPKRIVGLDMLIPKVEALIVVIDDVVKVNEAEPNTDKLPYTVWLPLKVFEPVVAYVPDIALMEPVRNWKFPSNSAWVKGEPFVSLYTIGMIII
jgi:hypothetical protein